MISGVDIWNPDEILLNQNVLIKNGKVSRIEPNGEPKKSKYCLLPSGVDTQIHLRVPGQAQKETAQTGLLAATFGGFGAVLTMPNTTPVIDTVEVLQQAQGEVSPISQELGIEVRFSAAITKGQMGKELVPFKDLAKAGAIAFTDDGKGVESDKLMQNAFETLTELKLPLLQHSEMPGHGGVLAPGPIQGKLNLPAYPSSPETQMIERDLHLLKKTPNTRYHVLHLSSYESLPLLQKAKQEGLWVSCEVTPHHLYFSSHDINPENIGFKMNPPLRGPQDREALVKGLCEGTIDWVATDHAPHESNAKKSLGTAAFGTLGLESALPVLMELQCRNQLSPTRLVQVFSTRPAEFLGLSRQTGEGWGKIQVGHRLRAVLFDQTIRNRMLRNDELKSLSKNSCFMGAKLPYGLCKLFTPRGEFNIRR